MPNQTPTLKTRVLLKRAKTVRAIADALGITTQAVRKWEDDVPPLRVYQLQQARPDWFTKEAKHAQPK